MVKTTILTLSIFISLSTLKSQTTNNPVNPRNQFTASYDRMGYDNISLKYSLRFVGSNWLKFGLSFGGDYDKTEPQISGSYPYSENYLAIGGLIGYERDKTIKDSKLHFVYGADIRSDLSRYKSKNENPAIPVENQTIISHTIYFGVGATLGFYYEVSPNFLVGSELTPNMLFYLRKSDDNDRPIHKGIEHGLTRNFSVISLKFRW